MTITIDIETMSLREKMDLIGQVWNSIDEDSLDIPVRHMEILNKRLNEDEKNPDPGKSWEDLRKELLDQ